MFHEVQKERKTRALRTYMDTIQDESLRRVAKTAIEQDLRDAGIVNV